MTPAARVAAAVAVLDEVLAGAPAEKTLTTWARQSRYAGSGDRAAVRDRVFDALRCLRSYGWLGGADTGRAILIGALRAEGRDPGEIFTGAAYAPSELGPDDPEPRDLNDAPPGVQLDVPDWLIERFRQSLGDDLEPILQALRHRAPVFLRCNARKTTRASAAEALRQDGIDTRQHPLSSTALEVMTNPRRIQASQAYRDGLVELQDAASQAVVDSLPLRDGQHVLDYCAGGGGKALAIAARPANVRVSAHDALPDRMRDLPVRAARAGVHIGVVATSELDLSYDLVLCDAPCSGSGAWRRTPEAKWRLTPERLADLTALQADILDQAAELVRPGGCLAYATCSLLAEENHQQIEAFLARHSGWSPGFTRRFTPLDGGDGFYVAQLSRRG
jgi:16S rRNA (cytosine967-C5)-methyltransferase